jgi:outer membrane protein, multidrug efflux system
MRRAIVSTSVLAFLIAGCTTLGPEPGRPDPRVDLASGYANARDPSLADSLTPGPGPMADWWRVLGDAELDGLVRDALARNLDVEAALARVRQARA